MSKANRDARQRIVYLHGFNSSPASKKARLFSDYCRRHADVEVVVPALPYDPARAIALAESCLVAAGASEVLLVGSSLGAYYATWLVERHGMKAALVNPAVSPCEHLGREFLGPQRNPYTGEEYEFTMAHVEALRRLDTRHIADPRNYLLLVQSGDEVLDHRLALALYAGCRQIVQEGGSHAFDNFAAVLPAILEFAGVPQHSSTNGLTA